VPRSNHLAFADDLSLYLNSEANANRLLETVLLFEQWSRLSLALPKLFVTAVMHGKGTELRTSETARDLRGRPEKTSRAHLCDLIAMEEDEDDHLLVSRPYSSGVKTIRYPSCLQDRSLCPFPQGTSRFDDSTKICLTCRAQWLGHGAI
jgi:hypothetical protein